MVRCVISFITTLIILDTPRHHAQLYMILGGIGALGITYYLKENGHLDQLVGVPSTPKFAKVDYDAVRRAIAQAMDNDDYDDGSYGPVLVRLAWHCAGTYDKASNTGGSNGATMRYVQICLVWCQSHASSRHVTTALRPSRVTEPTPACKSPATSWSPSRSAFRTSATPTSTPWLAWLPSKRYVVLHVSMHVSAPADGRPHHPLASWPQRRRRRNRLPP